MQIHRKHVFLYKFKNVKANKTFRKIVKILEIMDFFEKNLLFETHQKYKILHKSIKKMTFAPI